jgi:hypothetical protein
MPLLMLVMLVGGLLLVLLALSWAPLLGGETVVALIFMGVLLLGGVLILIVLSAVAIGEWWNGLRCWYPLTWAGVVPHRRVCLPSSSSSSRSAPSSSFPRWSAPHSCFAASRRRPSG